MVRTEDMNEIPSAEQYAEAFRMAEELPGGYLKMLRFQYNQPNCAVTARKLAEAVGYRSYNAANLHYGTLGRLVGEVLDRNPNRGWKVLATGEHPAGEEFNWIMRPEVAEALEKLGWVRDSEDPPEPKEAEEKDS